MFNKPIKILFPSHNYLLKRQIGALAFNVETLLVPKVKRLFSNINSFKILCSLIGILILQPAFTQPNADEFTGIQVSEEQPIFIIDSLSDLFSIPNSHLYLFEDTTNALSFVEINQKKFKPASTFPPAKKRTRTHIWWTKIQIHNQFEFEQSLWVHIPSAKATAYMLRDQESLQVLKTGSLVPNSERAIPFPHRFYNYVPIQLKANEKMTLFAKVSIPMRIFRYADIKELKRPLLAQNEFHQNRLYRNTVDGIFQTALLLLTLYCFIYFIYSRERFALYLIVYCMLSSIHFLNIDNYLYGWGITSEVPWVPDYLNIGIINLIIFVDLLFMRHYLNLKTRLPFWNRLFTFFIIASLVVFFVSMGVFYKVENFDFAYQNVNSNFQYAILLFRIAFIVRIVQVARFRYRMLALAMGVSIIFSSLAAVGHLLNIANPGELFQISVDVHVLIIVLALGYEAARNQKEKIAAVQEAMNKELMLKAQQNQVLIMEKDKEILEIRTKELQKMDQLKTHFFANVSHEFRTPLTLISGPLNSLLKSNDLSKKNRVILSQMKENASKLGKLINQILDLGKLNAEQMSLNPAPQVLYILIRRIISAFESHAEREGIQLNLTFSPHKELQIDVDKEKFETVLNNLLSNALKFTPSGGKISLEVNKQGELVQVSVADTGRGIPAEDLPRIFDRYFQTSRTNAPAEGGTGIGLAIGKEIARLFKGKLWAESEYGKGSRFVFEFPAKEVIGRLTDEDAKMLSASYYRGASTSELVSGSIYNSDIEKTNNSKGANGQPTTHHPQPTAPKEQTDNSEPRTQNPEPRTENRPTILIVEDSYDLRNYIRSILEKNYHILEAKNGAIAWQMLSGQQKDHHPQMIISDLMMPILDGYQLIEKIKNNDAIRHLPIIVLTARAELKDKITALRIGVDDYMTKPFEEEELLARIENLLRHSYLRKQYQSEILVERAKEKVHLEPIEVAEKSNQITKEDNAWLEKLETTILDNLGQFDFSIEQLAHELAASRWTLLRRIKQLTGLTATQYLQEVRLNHARNLLEKQQANSVKELSYKVGIKNVRYFSEQFKKRFGKLPSDYL